MGPLLDPIGDKLQAWIQCWGAVTFNPRSFFSQRWPPYPISTFHFFLGNQLLAYLLLFVASILFFLVFYPERLLGHDATNGLVEGLAMETAVFAVFVLLNPVFVFISSLVTLFVARLFASPAVLTTHVNSFLHLSAIEPLAMFGFAVFVLADDPKNIRLISDGVIFVGLGIWVVARVWSLVAGFFAVSFVHPIALKKRVCIYIIGFLPSYAILQTLNAYCSYWVIMVVFIKIND
jgi:hypothetical protein